MTHPPVSNWNCQDVHDWLVKEHLGQYADTFSKTHKIDGQTLLSIQEEDLRKQPLQIQVLADIKRLSAAIQKLKTEHSNEKARYLNSFSNVAHDRNSTIDQDCEYLENNNRHKNGYVSVELDDKIALLDTENAVKKPGIYAKRLDPEIFKTFLSFIYLSGVTLMVAFTIVVCHNRTPDRTKYPPLPDLILDNIPVIPWALVMCEIIALCLLLAWIVVIFFHKHRFIIIRRSFLLVGTLYLLRVVSMLVTSLSVPGRHMQCREKYATWHEMLMGTLEIWSGMGMSIFGVMSCGDYMFSGHTTIITLLNFFVIEYTPSRMYYLHILTWIANLSGMFFLLAAHVHYSIDVFIAFYITSRLFLYYHTLANNRALMIRDEARRKFWFPLLSYFESRCDGIVPNEYEWPHLTKRLCAIVKYLKPNTVGSL